MHDIVEPRGMIFALPVSLLWQHKADEPIGLVTAATVLDSGIRISAKLATGTHSKRLKARLDEAWSLLSEGVVRGLSVGFRVLESAPLKNGGTRFIATELLEVSCVSIPAHALATIEQIKGADRLLRRAARPALVRVARPALAAPGDRHRVVRVAQRHRVVHIDRLARTSRPSAVYYARPFDPYSLERRPGE
jgi:HK97 family phage prohead protease